MSDFWVQIHGLRFDRQNIINLNKIGRMLGRVLDTDLSGHGWKHFIRVRVEVEVNKPLCTGFPMYREKLSALWIPFKYEKLGNFCYGCGILGHDVKVCREEEVQSLWKEGITLGIHGNWLRAESSEFQLGIDLKGLKYSDLAECNLEVGSSSSRSLERIKSQDLGSSLSIQSLPKAVEVMQEMQ